MTSVGSADITKLTEALHEASKQSQVTTQQVLIQASNQILAEMEALVPVKTGKLRRSLGVKVSTHSVTIGPNEQVAPYASYVEFGTKPHTILPKKGKYLVFVVGGRKVFAKKVNHPGTAPQPYVQPAFDRWVDSLGTMAAEANVKVFTDNAK